MRTNRKTEKMFSSNISHAFLCMYIIVNILFISCSEKRENHEKEKRDKEQLEKIFFAANPPLTMDSMQHLLNKNESNKNDFALTFLYREIGKKERQNANFSKAIRLHRLGLEAASRINDTLEIVQALNNLGTDFRRLGMLPEAGNHHFQALQLSNIYSLKNEAQGRKNKMISLNGIGNIALSLNLLDSAELYFRTALKQEGIEKNILGQAINYANIGAVFENRKMYDSAFVYYEKSMKKNREANSSLGISLCHIHFGQIYKYKQLYKEAEQEYRKALDLLVNTQDKWHWLEACLAIAQLKMDTNQEEDALFYIHRAQQVAEEIKSPEHLSKVHNLLYQYDLTRSNFFSALTEYKLFKLYEDSIQGNRKINEVIDARIQYEKEKNNHNIAHLHAQNALEKRQKRIFIVISIIIVVILVASLVLLFYAYIHRTKTNRILNHIEQIRSDFFTKITHEFRSPLTVILGLSGQLKEKQHLSPQNVGAYLNAIDRQGKNLLNLVNQLLDIARLKTSTNTMEWKTGNIVAYVGMIAETFKLYAKEKSIELIFYSSETTIETDFVPDYINKIIENLLSNAIKYSREGDKIHILIERKPKDNEKVQIKVCDNGEGISKENLNRIFDIFYQVNNSKEKMGSGVGLTLVKELVEILKGKIWAESKIGEGSTFIVELPIWRNEKHIFSYWLPDEFSKYPIGEKELVREEDDEDEMILEIQRKGDIRPTLLLVEDNKDIALYIKVLFPANKYNILYARNGVEGLSMANKFIPDICITDIIMPLKNGMEMCVEMKNSPLLNHIPIIILTAKDSDENRVEGLKCGAEAYLRKPFNSEELKVRVEKLLENRNLLKEKYRGAIFKDEKLDRNDLNMDFLQHVTDIIYKEMKSTNFSPRKLAEELSMSVSQLNKKLNATTGYPASNYILQTKISHAKKILSTQDRTISEVAVECGIYDVNYFARIFKKSTGVTPSQFQRLPR